MDVFQPPPLYPTLLSRPLNLEKNGFFETQLQIKKKFRNLIQQSFFYIDSTHSIPKKGDFETTIERYSDRFSKSKKKDFGKFKPDWSRLPKELKHFYEKDRKKPKRKQVAPNLVKSKIKRMNEDDDIDKLVETISKDEEEDKEEVEEDEEKKKEAASEEENEEIEGDEEDVEEENDYIDNYFDNGETYGDEDLGGDDEGPVY
ncbi:DNA-directed RNA polymerase III subunit RPC7-like [Brachionus plicatilis]|uniref:DNA-directed RNA polymerase III subunit RPC7-like n=1 Tax=Brachionus plicatilis TaxID=10195 RepID=A0A3M7QQZ3_BRAPC|nr:DNA-directed RNA polymerase III subunit RPC7-like [Brachionus plicatilis]